MSDKSFEERVKDAFWSVVLEEPIKYFLIAMFLGFIFCIYWLFTHSEKAFGFFMACLCIALIFSVLTVRKYRQIKFIEENPHQALNDSHILTLNLGQDLGERETIKTLKPESTQKIVEQLTENIELDKTLEDILNSSVSQNPNTQIIDVLPPIIPEPVKPSFPDFSIKVAEPSYGEYKQVKHRFVGVEITNNSDDNTAKVQPRIQLIEESSAFSDIPFPSKFDTLEPSYLTRKGHPFKAKETSFSLVARQSTEDLQKIMIVVENPQIIPISFGMTVYSLEFDVSVIRDVFGHCYGLIRVALYLNEHNLIELKEIEAE